MRNIIKLFLITSILNSCLNESFDCRRNRIAFNKTYNGIVTKSIYNSKNNHNYEVFYLENGDIFNYEDKWYKNSLYDAINVGDSINKPAKKLYFEIYKRDTMIIIDIDLPCEKKYY